jgi:hypothetical protein
LTLAGTPLLDAAVDAFDEDGVEDVDELHAVATNATVVSPTANKLALLECRILGAPFFGAGSGPSSCHPHGQHERNLSAMSG